MLQTPVAIAKVGALAAVLLAAAGCASTDVNPAKPSSAKGYLDFQAQEQGWSWDVQQFEPRSGKLKPLYSKLSPPKGNVLRLEMPPGKPRLRVALLNRLVVHPVTVEPEIAVGQVTLVRAVLQEAGEASVRTKTYTYGGTAKGRWGGRTEIDYRTSKAFRLVLTESSPEPYRQKQAMPYWQPPSQSKK